MICDNIEKLIIELFDLEILDKLILSTILNNSKYEIKTSCKSKYSNMTLDYIILYYYNQELFIKLKNESEGINEYFYDLFYKNDFIYNFERSLLLKK